MKTKITVGWIGTMEIEVDPSRMDDPDYREEIQAKAHQDAFELVRAKEGMITDCEAFPQLLE